MSSLFSGLKEKIADKLAEFKGSTGPQDPNERYAFDLVEAATSDELIAADWNLNLNVVDFVSGDVRLNSGRVLRAIKRSLVKPNTKVQLLSLTLLEACVKNCPVEFHVHLATSELWSEVVKLAEDTSITRVDVEVRDKLLGMIEDYSRFLQPYQFQAAYEALLDRGVDFPVRAPTDAVPIITPPASAAAAAAASPAANTAAAAPAELPPADGAATGVPAAALDARSAAAPAGVLMADLDEQDRAAIQAALAELEAEAQAAQEAARIAEEADAEELRQQRLIQQQQQQQRHHAQFLQQQQQQSAVEAEAALGLLAAAHVATASATATAIATPAGAASAVATAGGGTSMGMAVFQYSAVPYVQQPAPPLQQQQQQQHPPADPGAAADPATASENAQQPHPQPPADAAQMGPDGAVSEKVATLLETTSNTTMLLSEMLASVPDSEPLAVREPYVAEVADTCVRLRSRLERDLMTLSDEELLSSALSQHEELSRVLMRYDELLAAAEAVAPTVPHNAAEVALSHAAASRGLQAAEAAPTGQLQPLQQYPDPQQQQQGPLAAAMAGAMPAGQKVVAVAAALKERFTGAFDKLMAAAASARTPGAQPSSAATMGPAASMGTAMGFSGGGGHVANAPMAVPPDGAFTLLEDEDEGLDEGTSLITKRAAQLPVMALPAAEAAVAAAGGLPLQQLLYEATAAAAMPPPAPDGPDLINFDDDDVKPSPPPAPAAATMSSPPPPPPPPPQQQQQQTPAAAANPRVAGGLDDLLSGLTIHAPPAERGNAPPCVAVAASPSSIAGPANRMSHGGCSGDHLVDALDMLVSQASATASPDVGTPVGNRMTTSSGGEPPQPPPAP